MKTAGTMLRPFEPLPWLWQTNRTTRATTELTPCRYASQKATTGKGGAGNGVESR